MSRSPRHDRILGIETSTLPGEVALAWDGQIIASARLPVGRRPTASLVPTILALCHSANWSPRDLQLICVDIGPGSFTGLRVGITCAKVLAFATGGALGTVRSLDAVAENATANGPIEVVFDAARGQLFCCRYQRSGTAWRPVHEIRVIDANAWAASLTADTTVMGPALSKYRAIVPPHVPVADDSLGWPRAAAVIELALRQPHDALPTEYFSLEPIYLRPSAAEEKMPRQV